MRKQSNMTSAFMPMHEKEWEARLFIDEAIKTSVEYHLEAMARALSGRFKIKFRYADGNKLFTKTDHICGDDEKWVVKTSKHKINASVDAYHFWGNNEIEIWLQIIDFFAGKKSIFPCGGASLPNEKLITTHKDDK